MKKFFYIFSLLFVGLVMTSCSETDDTVEEFPDWQNTNETYFNSLYNTAKQKVDAGNTSWKVIKCYSMPEESSTYTPKPENYIVVEVLEEGKGSGSPIYTDSVRCHYQGRLLPSTSYTKGFIFDQSYYGTFSTETAVPSSFSVSGLVDGFATALQNMHIGDYWRVYMPYQLGYGTSDSSSGNIPAYSTLIFEIRLVSYWHPGAGVTSYK